MERSTIFKFGKPSISMGHLSHGYVSHNQRVYIAMENGPFIDDFPIKTSIYKGFSMANC